MIRSSLGDQRRIIIHAFHIEPKQLEVIAIALTSANSHANLCGNNRPQLSDGLFIDANKTVVYDYCRCEYNDR